ncbi:Crp/Fnr family transcriptional regulator [uncultured Bacteroides sp.]|uniref:Crp/Fnr family transcriptional regulator n=1 Tax=uncultured Bacteroides sp. TaxID=162156 RepID=UPI002AABA247|nr:Crp/Fnr family transcriptional regulator [uncultured Bacteroides sp.]
MKETDKIKEFISSIIQLNDDDWLLINEFIEVRRLTKNKYFLKEGDICDSIAFINYGLFIYYKTLDNADEKTTDFAIEGEWITNNHSRLNNSPSHLSIKAIEDSELLIIKNKDLLYLYCQIPQLEKFGRILMEQAYVKLVQLSIDLQVLPAKERYQKLLDNYPEIFHRLPLYHIANYLGIAPKSLSRIRNAIFNKK